MKRSVFKNPPTKLGNAKECVERYRIGLSTLNRWAEEQNAVRRFGKRKLYDITKLDKALDEGDC